MQHGASSWQPKVPWEMGAGRQEHRVLPSGKDARENCPAVWLCRAGDMQRGAGQTFASCLIKRVFKSQ